MKIWARLICLIVCISMAVGVLSSCDIDLGDITGGGESDAYITELEVNKKGELVVIFSDDEEENIGPFSYDGEEDGIVDISVSKKGKVTVTMSDGESETVGYTYTDENEGEDDVIEDVYINEDGELIVVRVSGDEENLGKVMDKGSGADDGECTDHVDKNKDNKCDECGERIEDEANDPDDVIRGQEDVTLRYFDRKEWQVFSDGKVSDKDALWEPGRVEIVYFELENGEDEALDVCLRININETSGMNASGGSFYLSDYLEYAFLMGVNGEKDPMTDRSEIIAAAKESSVKLSSTEEYRIGMPGNSVKYFAFVVYMPESVGNEANSSGGGANPELELVLDGYTADHVHTDENDDGSCDGCGMSESTENPDATSAELYHYGKDGWEPVTDGVNPFGVAHTWFPGCLSVTNFKITNNTDKAQYVGINLSCTEPTPAINAYGGAFYARDYLRCAILQNVQPGAEPFGDYEEAVAYIGDSFFGANMGIMTGTMLQPGSDYYFAVVIFMPDTVGDEAVAANNVYSTVWNVKLGNDSSYDDDICLGHYDENGDGKCDKCGAILEGECEHSDDDGDMFCDDCGADLYLEGDCVHEDNDKDGICDGCRTLYEWWRDITYDPTEIIFEMSQCSSNEEFASTAERFLSGEQSQGYSIDQLIAERNAKAYEHTRLKVRYTYLPDVTDNSYGNCVDHIYQEAMVATKNSPDIFSNYSLDLLAASLRGSFANIHSTTRGENYISIAASGYMNGIMDAYTVGGDKQYIIASDYFIDVIMATYVIPVNIGMFTDADAYVDLCEQIISGQWTYADLLGIAGMYAEANDAYGLALSLDAISGAGLIYTNSSGYISYDKYLDSGRTNYNELEAEPTAFFAILEEIGTLATNEYTLLFTNENYEDFGAYSPKVASRTMFVQNKAVFGGVVMFADLERAAYQEFKGMGTLGVVPVPVANSSETYRATFHPIARLGAISHSTRKFSQCTALIQYLSTHSADIFNEYYDYNLTYDIVGGEMGAVEIIQYMRATMSAPRDMIIDSVINDIYASSVDDNRFEILLMRADFVIGDAKNVYLSLRESKQSMLENIENELEVLPD